MFQAYFVNLVFLLIDTFAFNQCIARDVRQSFGIMNQATTFNLHVTCNSVCFNFEETGLKRLFY